MDCFEVLDEVSNIIHNKIVDDIPESTTSLVVSVSRGGILDGYNLKALTLFNGETVSVVGQIPATCLYNAVVPRSLLYEVAAEMGDNLVFYAYQHTREDNLD